MNIAIERIADIVSLYLKEFPDWRIMQQRIDGGEHRSIKEMCEVVVEDIARSLTRTLPIDQFQSPVDIRTLIYTKGEVTEEGENLACELPADFCRLHSLKFSGWPQVLSEENRGDAQRLALGDAAPEWLAQRKRRPWIRLDNAGDKGVSLVCSEYKKGWPETATYIPLPAYDAPTGTLRNVDPAIIGALSKRIAKIIGQD